MRTTTSEELEKLQEAFRKLKEKIITVWCSEIMKPIMDVLGLKPKKKYRRYFKNAKN